MSYNFKIDLRGSRRSSSVSDISTAKTQGKQKKTSTKEPRNTSPVEVPLPVGTLLESSISESQLELESLTVEPVELAATRSQLKKAKAVQISSRAKAVIPAATVTIEPHTRMAGSYSNWTFEVDLISSQSFVALIDLVRCLGLAHRVPFAIKARRDEARETMGNLISSGFQKFSKTTRFPDTPHVNTTTGIVADLLDKILSALDYGEKYCADAALQQVNNKFGSLDDAKQMYYKGIQRLLDVLVKTKPEARMLFEIYDRVSFETSKGLTWA